MVAIDGIAAAQAGIGDALSEEPFCVFNNFSGSFRSGVFSSGLVQARLRKTVELSDCDLHSVLMYAAGLVGRTRFQSVK
jgi:hypothetical protein